MNPEKKLTWFRKFTIPVDTEQKLAGPLKIHKHELFFGFDFEFCTVSLLVMLKYEGFDGGPLRGEVGFLCVVLRLRK